MSLDLRRELTELASQAPRYDNADAVMRTVHRRRRGRVTTAAAAMATVLTVFAVVAVQHDARPEPVGPAPGDAAPALPSTVDEPAAPAEMLPADRAVGRSSLVYQTSDGGPAYLVEPDGSQYQVPFVALTDPDLIPRYRNLPLSLSPDGRWLVIVGDDATRIRDLTSTTVRSIAALSMPDAWSPDGRWLVLVGPVGRTLLEVPSGRTWTLPGPADAYHLVPAGDGQIVSVPVSDGDDTLTLERFDPVHGSPTHSIVVTATDQLRDHRRSGDAGRLSADLSLDRPGPRPTGPSPGGRDAVVAGWRSRLRQPVHPDRPDLGPDGRRHRSQPPSAHLAPGDLHLRPQWSRLTDGRSGHPLNREPTRIAGQVLS